MAAKDDPRDWFPVGDEVETKPAKPAVVTPPNAVNPAGPPSQWFAVHPDEPTATPQRGGVVRNLAAGAVGGTGGLIDAYTNPVHTLIVHPLLKVGTTAYDAVAPTLGLPRLSPEARNMLLDEGGVTPAGPGGMPAVRPVPPGSTPPWGSTWGVGPATPSAGVPAGVPTPTRGGSTEVPGVGTQIMDTIADVTGATRPADVPATTRPEQYARIAGSVLPASPFLPGVSVRMAIPALTGGGIAQTEAEKAVPDWAKPGVGVLTNLLATGAGLGVGAGLREGANALNRFGSSETPMFRRPSGVGGPGEPTVRIEPTLGGEPPPAPAADPPAGPAAPDFIPPGTRPPPVPPPEPPAFVPPVTAAPKTGAPAFVPPGTGEQFLGRDWVQRAGASPAGYDMGKGGGALVDAAQNALAAGNEVVLVTDRGNKQVPIVAIKNGMLQDAGGQSWGSFSVATDGTGTEGLRIIPATKPTGPSPGMGGGGATVRLTPEQIDTEALSSGFRPVQPGEALAPGQEVATSHDGREWVRIGNRPDSVGAAATPEQLARMTPEQAREVQANDEQWRLISPRNTVNGRDDNIYLPGSNPTEAERSGKVPDAQSQVMLENHPDHKATLAANRKDNEEVRLQTYLTEAGNVTTKANLERARKAEFDPRYERLWGNKRATDPADVLEVGQRILAGRDGMRPLVRKTLDPIIRGLTRDGELVTDPELLFGLREAINDTLSDTSGSGAHAADRSRARLLQMRDALDEAIERGAPGFKQLQADYAERSRAISTQEALQAALPSLQVGADKVFTFNSFNRFMNGVVKARRLDPASREASFSQQTMDQLWNIYADLHRYEQTQKAGSTKGSPTVPWAIQLANIGGQTALHGTVGLATGGAGNYPLQIIQKVVGGAREKNRRAREVNRLLNPNPPPNALGPD